MAKKTRNPSQNCAAQHFGPWMVEPKWFGEAVSAVKAGVYKAPVRSKEDDPVSAGSERIVQRDADGWVMYAWEIDGGVAYIPITGQTTKGDSSFGGTSNVRVRQAVREAAGREDVDAIMLLIDSPGGTVAGTAELAREVMKARKSGKFVHAHYSDLGASAAYWVGSQANYITAEPTTLVGSIGTVAVVDDTSGMYEAAGVKVHVIATGPYKGAFVDGAPVTDEHLADLRREVNDLNNHFLRGVSQGRGMSMDEVREIATGQVWIAAEAKQRGLIDAVASFDEAVTLLHKELSNMEIDQKKFNEVAAAHPDWLAAAADPLVKNARTEAQNAAKAEWEPKVAEAKTKGFDEGVENERGRCKALLNVEAFASDRDFLIKQIDAGHDVAKAKAEHYDVLSAKLKDTEAGNKKKDDTRIGNGTNAATIQPDTANPDDQPVSEERRKQLLAMAGMN